MKKPMFSILDEFGPIHISLRMDGKPHKEGEFAPHLHIKAYHEDVTVVNITPRDDETIEMRVPRGFTRDDMLRFVELNGTEIYQYLQEVIDEEHAELPVMLSYDSMVPFLGEYVPICKLPDNDSREGFRNHVLYLKPGLSGNEIRNTALSLMGEMAYDILKPRVDRYAKAMGAQYSSLEIDDGRRTWGSFNIETRVIFLTRRLLMISETGIDSIIIHELAHSFVFAHNESFHNIVEAIMPNYDQVDECFKADLCRLFEEGWI